MQTSIYHAEHEAFRRSVRAFLAKEVVPHFPDWEAAGCVPHELYRKLGDLGMLGLRVPAEYGGGGEDGFLYSSVWSEECSRAGVSLGGAATHMNLVIPYILRQGTEEQKRRWLPDMAAGRRMGAIAMTEPGTGSDLAGIRTTARLEGGHWTLSGGKTFITGGINADLVVVVARTSEHADRRVGLSLLVVDADGEGFGRGRNLEKTGLRATDTAELFFDDVAVPADHLLGEEGQAFRYLAHNLVQERLGIALGSQVSAEKALRITVSYVRDRTAFGRPVSSFQNTKFELTSCHVEVTAGRALLDRANARPRRRRAHRRRGVHGQGLLHRDAEPGDRPVPATPRRVRVHAGVRDRPHVHRRARLPYLRWHQRGPARHHRQVAGTVGAEAVIELQQLRHFVAVAEARSISGAGTALDVPQSTISQAVHALEKELGAALFHRTGRGMTLTSAGHGLLSPARRILRETRQAEAAVSAEPRRASRSVWRGTPDGVAGGAALRGRRVRGGNVISSNVRAAGVGGSGRRTSPTRRNTGGSRDLSRASGRSRSATARDTKATRTSRPTRSHSSCRRTLRTRGSPSTSAMVRSLAVRPPGARASAPEGRSRTSARGKGSGRPAARPGPAAMTVSSRASSTVSRDARWTGSSTSPISAAPSVISASTAGTDPGSRTCTRRPGWASSRRPTQGPSGWIARVEAAATVSRPASSRATRSTRSRASSTSTRTDRALISSSVLVELYGGTEGSATVITSEEWLTHVGSVGRALPHVSLRILDDDRDEVPVGEVGTVYFRNEEMSFAYLGDPAKTAASRLDGHVTLGDLGRLDEDGYLYLSDRSADLIISGGVNIYPAEIEHALLELPGVTDACVVGRPDEKWGESVHAVVVADRPGTDEEIAAALGAELRSRIAGYKIPRSWAFAE